jgi:hypothetical protein
MARAARVGLAKPTWSGTPAAAQPSVPAHHGCRGPKSPATGGVSSSWSADTAQISRRKDTAVNRPPLRDWPWLTTDRTGGPLDAVLDQLRQAHPGLVVEQLEVTHCAADDNIYFLGEDNSLDQVQVDTAPHGQAPCILEAAQRHRTSDPTESIAVISARLGRQS